MARVGCSERTALKDVYYQGWERSPAQVGCMRQVLRAGALGRPRGKGRRWRREVGSGWGTHVNPRLVHVNVWQKPLQYCKVISLKLIKINKKKFSKPGFSNTWTVSFQMFKLVLEKAEESEIKWPTSLDHRKSKRVPEKHLFLLYWLCQSPWLCGSQ